MAPSKNTQQFTDWSKFVYFCQDISFEKELYE